MLRIVHWVLLFAPIGIFALALGLALDNGLAVASFVARIMIITAAAAVIAILLGYAIAWAGGGLDPIRFGRAIGSAQALAAGTCSSAATLPAMIETSQERLRIDPVVGGSVLPLAASIFRFATTLYKGAVVILFMCAMGLPLDPAVLLVGGAVLILGAIGSAGLPGAAVMYASWAAGLQILGLPLELVPLLIAANALPDILLTAGNVTADLAVTSVVARRFRGSVGTPSATPIQEAA
jgi:Na+/H+-dicarboxylate symporter